MSRGAFITGTGTGVGKTIVAGAITALLRENGLDVGVMKPFETGLAHGSDGFEGSDAGFLARLAGVADRMDAISPVRLAEPAAPLVAARIAGIDIQIGAVLNAFAELCRRHKFVVVEGAGGLAVPITEGYLMAHLAFDLGLPLLIVSPLGLGAINHTFLTVQYARSLGLDLAGIVLNSVEPETGSVAERSNPHIIESLTGLPILGKMPHLAGWTPASPADDLLSAARSGIPWESLARALGLQATR